MRVSSPPIALGMVLVRHRLQLALATLVLAACGRTHHDPTASPAAAGAPSNQRTEADHGVAGATASRGSYNDCPELARAVEAAFAARSACSVAADCTLMWPGCPFGCYRPVQRGAVDEVWARIVKYNDHCAGCRYRCRLWDVAAICKDGVCDLPPEPPRPRAKLLRIPRER